MPELLLVDEVASILRISPRMVRVLVDRGSLPAVRLGRKTVRIRRDSLDRLLG